MATNKNATIRYQALDKCFRNPGRKYFMIDLVEACNNALLDIDPNSTGIQKRQVYDDIKFMKDSRGFNAPIESFKDGKKVFYKYDDINFSINNQPLNEQEAQQLKESLLTLSRFKGLPQFEWIEEIMIRLEEEFKFQTNEKVISFDENPFLKGIELLGDLYNAIVNKSTIEVQYQPFKKTPELRMIIYPYHLKQYNNRWFLFGLNDKEKVITNIALDRIVSLEQVNIPYIVNTKIDFEEYFEDIIGVSVPINSKCEKIVLRISKELWPYIKTKPIHGSQKQKQIQDDYILISLELIPNFELCAKILSFGKEAEVIEPQSLRDDIKSQIDELNKLYLTSAD
jgi:predicted DNA-binding transcriptional regulator YafY